MRKTLGRSVYLTAFEKQAASLAVCPAGGAPVFLSLYITEEFSSEYVHRAAEICHWLAAQGWQVLADISRRTLAVCEEPNAADAARIAAAGPQVMAMHNFYPRPETGLDKAFLQESTDALHAAGLQVLGFVPGDCELRGPVFAGLPTL